MPPADRRPPFRPRRGADPSPSLPPGRLVLGLQPVREAVRVHGPRVTCVWIDKRPQPRFAALERFALDQGAAQVLRLGADRLDQLAPGTAHQGVAAWAPELELLSAASLLASPGLLAVVLDGIQDPQNFGAVVRSAVAVAGAAVVWPEHASAPLSPATFRASAGGIEHARLCRVASLPDLLGTAIAQGIAVVGLDAQATRQLRELDLTGPTLLVVGGEHTGLARSVRRGCSELASLLPPRHIDSLNASVAAGLALYEAMVQRSRTGT